MRQVILVMHNLRSCHNVGALLRTAEGLGVKHVYLTGYTPYPSQENDVRLPHITKKIDARLHKTALGAERLISWSHYDDIDVALTDIRRAGYEIAALEQDPAATDLVTFVPRRNVALIVGREIGGIEPEVLAKANTILAIPMLGQKESFNVAAAAAMALYHLVFTPS